MCEALMLGFMSAVLAPFFDNNPATMFARGFAVGAAFAPAIVYGRNALIDALSRPRKRKTTTGSHLSDGGS